MSRAYKIAIVALALIQAPIWMLGAYHFGRASAWAECGALIDRTNAEEFPK